MQTASPAAERLHVLVLAAGASVRLGRPKQLVLYKGVSLLHRAAVAATQLAGSRVTVVLGAHSRELEHELQGLEASVILNSDWRDGLASSIRKGLLTLAPARQAALLMPCDLPLLEASTLDFLATRWNDARSRIVTCQSDRGAGLPAIVPRRYFKALMSIKGDPGINSFLARHRELSEHISLPELQLDIDSKADLEALHALEGNPDNVRVSR